MPQKAEGFEQKGWTWITLMETGIWKMSTPVFSTEQEAETFAAANVYWGMLSSFTQQRLIQVSVFEGSAVVN